MSQENTNKGNNEYSLLKKQASFVQNSLSTLDAGMYEITVSQSLDEANGGEDGKLPGDFAPMTKKFGVLAPRYQLAESAIHSVFPPKNSTNEYSNDLAHVVLEKEKLPWLRSPWTPKDKPIVNNHSYEENGKTLHFDDDVATWMGVMVFSDRDFDGVSPEHQIKKGTVLDLIPDNRKVVNPGSSDEQGTMPGGSIYSQFSYFLESKYSSDTNPISPGVGSKPSDSLKYIDVPASLFNSISPSLDDLKMMAHVREVVMSDKPIPAHTKVKPSESYGLVIGNRLPDSFPKPQEGAISDTPPKGKNVAMLVSLENMEFSLKGHEGTSYYDSNISSNPKGKVRLVVLYSWSFTSWFDTSMDFLNLMTGLNGRKSDGTNTVLVPNPLMRVPNPPNYDDPKTDDKAIVENMLKSGYVPFNHITRVPYKGKPVQLISWYRGPLLPFPKQSSTLPAFIENGEPTVFSADKLLRFDPQVGMYDVSYAAAWQLGRLLSVGEKSFSVPLYQWKKTVEEQYKTLLESEVLSEQYAELIQLYQDVEAAENASVERQLYTSIISYLQDVSKNR